MKNEADIFKETLQELGFANHKPSQMTNSDYWLCTCTAMRRWADYLRAKNGRSSKSVICSDVKGDIIGSYPSGASAARELGIRNCRVSDIIHGRQKTTFCKSLNKKVVFKRLTNPKD